MVLVPSLLSSRAVLSLRIVCPFFLFYISLNEWVEGMVNSRKMQEEDPYPSLVQGAKLNVSSRYKEAAMHFIIR